MDLGEVLEIGLVILGSIGVGGGIVFGLSSWLGKVWANRLMENERAAHAQTLVELQVELRSRTEKDLRQLESDLKVSSEKTLGLHSDKLATYRRTCDITAEIIADLTTMNIADLQADTLLDAKKRFERQRLQLYGYLGIVAPQAVMDAHDTLVDVLLAVLNSERAVSWQEIRELALNMLNAIRVDVGIDPTPIAYRGDR